MEVKKKRDDQKIEEDKEVATQGVQEYKQSTQFKNDNITATTVQDMVKEQFQLTEEAKTKTFCKRCSDITHVDPKFCTRKCPICHGNHWKQQCTAYLRCNWCGIMKGQHNCTEKNLTSLLMICPICLFPGHCADDCDPLYTAISFLMGHLSKKTRKRKAGRKSRFPRNRRYRRRQRRTRK